MEFVNFKSRNGASVRDAKSRIAGHETAPKGSVSVKENTDAKFISLRVDLDRIGFDEHSLRAIPDIARQDESGSLAYRRSA
jgi:hypothetical protein